MTQIADVLGLTWWGLILLYLLAGWLVAGALVWFRQPLTNVRMIVCLVAWWGALLAFVIAGLVVAAQWVFSPDTGPIAMFVSLIHAAGAPRRRDWRVPVESVPGTDAKP